MGPASGNTKDSIFRALAAGGHFYQLGIELAHPRHLVEGGRRLYSEYGLGYFTTGFIMDDLEPHDVMHLNAADGWLGLGNVIEADAELKKVTLAMRSHPEVLAVRYRMLAKAECWEACEEIADNLVTLVPKSAFGWIHRSYALHEMKSTQGALDKLLPALDLFPDEILIRYNLACYECVLGNMGQAKLHLAAAFTLAQNQKCFDEWKAHMLGDPDLKPLWDMWDEVEI